MADASIRERRRQTHESEEHTYDDEEKSDTFASSSRRTPRLLFALIALAAVFTIYWFPNYFKALLEPWIELSPSTLHGVRQDAVVNFSAEVARRDAVVEAFKHAWLAYERDAMGDDEYKPISHKASNLSDSGGIGYTVVDSIDTLMIMGLDAEVARARDWIENKLSFDREGNFNTFETTIRVLGGLLSAYHLSGGDELYLQNAVDLADRMLPAFDTPTGVPLSSINLAKRQGIPDASNNGYASTAEASTLQLEFRYLSMLTDEDVYWRTAEKVMAVIKRALATPKLATIFINPQDGMFMASAIRLGSRGDSYYEYLLKQYLQTERTEDVYREMYAESMDAIHSHLIQKSATSHLTYTAELVPEHHPGGELTWRLMPKQDHLVCFLGGSLMLGATTSGALVDKVSTPPKPSELSAEGRRDWRTGVELIKTCMETHRTATGLSPEIVHFRIPTDGLDSQSLPNDWYIKGAAGGGFSFDARYILRPETVESLFIAFRLTGDVMYRDFGWAIFRAIEKHCRIATGGYASVVNVDRVPVQHEDKMETFFMSETLKYLFLLFSDADVLPLSEYVFNTEAHPLPIFTPTIRTGFS